jgi:predicted nucleic acid-binding Zn ribbon protein
MTSITRCETSQSERRAKVKTKIIWFVAGVLVGVLGMYLYVRYFSHILGM